MQTITQTSKSMLKTGMYANHVKMKSRVSTAYYSVDGTGIPWNEDMLCIPDADMHAYDDLIYDLLFDFLPNEYLPSVNGQEKYYIMECLQFYDGNGPAYPEGYKYFHKGLFKYGVRY